VSAAKNTWRIYERDVDIVLAEEFSINSDFASWVLSKTSKFQGRVAEVEDVHVSLANSDGESDLVIIHKEKNSPQRFAILVENKIDAIFQPNQALRYEIRGQAGSQLSSWSEFEHILFAPESYLKIYDGDHGFSSALSYEAIRDWLENYSENSRIRYRAAFFCQAIPQGRSAYVRTKDQLTDAFWSSAYLYKNSNRLTVAARG